MTVVDEFAFLEEPEYTEEEPEVKPEKSNIDKFNEFKQALLDRKGSTYQGVPSSNILDCISIESNDTLQYDHVVFTFKLEKLVDINDRYIKEIKIPDFVEEIRGNTEDTTLDDYYRYQLLCNRLQLVVIPSSVILINSKTFLSASRLEKVAFTGLIDEEEKAIEDWFSYGLDTKENELVCIGNDAFGDCKNLKTVDMTVCNKLSMLGNNVFRSCNLTNIKISDIIDLEDKREILSKLVKSMPEGQTITIGSTKYNKEGIEELLYNMNENTQDIYNF